jgi:hypothetical protein
VRRKGTAIKQPNLRFFYALGVIALRQPVDVKKVFTLLEGQRASGYGSHGEDVAFPMPH